MAGTTLFFNKENKILTTKSARNFLRACNFAIFNPYLYVNDLIAAFFDLE